MRGTGKEAKMMEQKRQRILETGFELFSSRSIESVTMPEVAKASGVGRATLYRYFLNKTDLVIAISTWKTKEFYDQYSFTLPDEKLTKLNAAQRFELYLDAFIELYRNHKDLLRYNQFFNIFIQGQPDIAQQISPFTKAFSIIEQRFHTVYSLAQEDRTLRTDIPETVIFSTMVHLMMAAATRYALGLIYQPDNGLDPEAELTLLKNMIIKEFTNPVKQENS